VALEKDSKTGPASERLDKLLWLGMQQDMRAGVPGAVVKALRDVVAAGQACADFDAAMCFVSAMGLEEAQELGFEPFGGRHPLDEKAKVPAKRLARLFGRNPIARIQQLQEERERDPEGMLEKIAPLVTAAGVLARKLCADLLRAADELARGDYSEAITRRESVVRQWNRLVDRSPVDAFPYPRLCGHCGRPMILVSKEALGAGKFAPALVHPGCRNAARLAARRAARRTGRKT
jgi:hypothetical protein